MKTTPVQTGEPITQRRTSTREENSNFYNRWCCRSIRPRSVILIYGITITVFATLYVLWSAGMENSLINSSNITSFAKHSLGSLTIVGALFQKNQ